MPVCGVEGDSDEGLRIRSGGAKEDDEKLGIRSGGDVGEEDGGSRDEMDEKDLSG